MVTLEELKELQSKLSRLYDEGVISIHSYAKEIHLTVDCLVTLSKKNSLPIEVIYTKDEDYPIELLFFYDDLKLFALCKNLGKEVL